MMETYTKVCTKSDWTMFFKEEDYERVRDAMINGVFLELENLFGSRETIDGSDLINVFVSTKEGRLKYEQLAQMLKNEEEEAKGEEEKQSWE